MKQRIAFIHNEFPNGGGERVTIDIASYLIPMGYEIYVFATRFDKSKDCRIDEVPDLKVILMPQPDVESSHEDKDFILQAIVREDINVFVSVFYLLPDLIDRINRTTACKTVWALHNVPFWEIKMKVAKAQRKVENNLLKRLEQIFISYPKYCIFKGSQRKIKSRYLKRLKQYDTVVVLCDKYKEILVMEFGEEFARKIVVINNSERQMTDINLNKRRQFTFIGRLDYSQKRVDRLIKAWSLIQLQLVDWQLLIVGDGPDSERLKRYAVNVGAERIVFAGYQSDLRKYYNETMALCLVSNYEGWPLCLTEAQSAGVIPIAFNCVAGIEAILAPSGVNGMLVEPFDVDKFAAAMLSVANLDEVSLGEMQQNVLNKSKDYSIDIVGEKWRKLFETLSE